MPRRIEQIRRRCWEILETAEPEDGVSHAFDIFIVALILLNILAMIIGSVEAVEAAYGGMLYAFEVVSVTIFSVEYALRIWTCTIDPRFRADLRGRFRYGMTPMALIDLLAIAPFFLAYLTIDLRFLRIFRLFRLVRMLKVARYTVAMLLFENVIRAKREELVLTGSVMVTLIVISSCAMYSVEHDAQPEVFPDIPTTMWWSIVTLTTVGYGDVFPVTGLGRAFGALIAICGIGMVALPTGIIGAGFVEEIERQKTRKNAVDSPHQCPHCGKDIPSQ